MASSTSISSSYPETTPLSQWDLALSQAIYGLGQQQLQWASNTFANTSAVTDQMIGQFMQNSTSAQNQANNYYSDWTNQIEPQISSEIQDANTYSSTPRIQENMGAAESATGQAANQGRINAETTLQSYGIDPSSGRYQELEQAQRAGAAAAQAGAGQQAELATENTGRQLREQAITTGQNLPGFSVNALNASTGDISGAASANVANANAGANLMNTAAPYFADAMNIKYPPNASSSASNTQSGGSSGGGGGGGNQGGGGGGGGNGSNNSGGDPSGVDTGNYYGSGAGDNGDIPSYDGSGGGFSDTGSSSDTFDSSGDSGYAAGGGVLPAPTTGGHVPMQASPSMGQNTDDVNARLNAGEFVVPRDVAAWKGQEFFQKLIDESRRKRLGAPAKGKPKPAMAGPPRFQSHPIPMPQHNMGAQ